ncbi:hypothetical protein AR685_00035 [Chryseobacterium sp. JAH]|nr:hypothetical protein AR685_00035 [Chryseobacterium sp. JAH]
MPCSDVNAQSSQSENPQVFVSEDHPHSDKKDDACSPFCFCSCCQITVTAFKIEPLLEIASQIPFYYSNKILFHKNNIAYQVYHHIWQPPKI